MILDFVSASIFIEGFNGGDTLIIFSIYFGLIYIVLIFIVYFLLQVSELAWQSLHSYNLVIGFCYI